MKKALWFVFCFIFLFLFAKISFAEITTPIYTVDYKTQVIFGDSLEVSGYQGLENYVADYVGGYLHITYSTSHGYGYSSGYPPYLYIRSGDPTVFGNTTYLYGGLAYTINNNANFPTDVYFIDIQFSATGYREIVTRGLDRTPYLDISDTVYNMDENTFIALANNYPLYNPPIAYSMSFKPMRLVYPPPTNILSFEISTSTNSVTVHNYLRPDVVGGNVNLSITNTNGQFYSSNVVATSSGDFYYTWKYPSLPETNAGFEDYTFYTDISTSTILKSKSVTMNIETPVIGYPGYLSPNSDSFVTIPSSYDHIIQTLGTGLSGALNRVDIQTSNFSYYYYGSISGFQLFECDNYSYVNEVFSGVNCTNPFSTGANTNSKFEKSVQSFFANTPVILNPTKYYYFISQGNNQFNALPSYYGSATDVVEGECYKSSLTQGKAYPCPNVSDLYFRMYGVSKVVEPPKPAGHSNVLFLPGLEASRLYKWRSVTCDFNCEDQLWEPNTPSDVEDLYLNTDGTSKNGEIYTKDIIDVTNVSPIIFTQNIYKNFIKKLDNLVSSGEIKEWKPYAYDWRIGIDDIIENGTKYENDQVITLIGTLQSLVDTSDTDKVTIIAHSNGGLLAKALIKKLQDDNNDLLNHIDNIILVASPQLGTPTGLFAILHGYDQMILNGFIMSESSARQLAQNMTSAYGLIPSAKYYEQAGIINPVKFTATASSLYKNKYGTDVNTYTEQKDFVLGVEGRLAPQINNLISPIIGNTSLLTQAETLHNSIDNMTIPSSIKVIQIAGWGKSTITGMTYTDSDIEPIYSIRGDKTVFMPSALYGQGTKYWLDLSNSTLEHKDILEDSQLLDFIGSILEQKPLTFSTVVDTEPVQIGNRLHLSVHSPVTIGVTDKNGKFTGKICDANSCYIQEDILGSTYQEIGEGKYVTLAEEKLDNVTMQGTDTGTFTFDFEKVSPDGSSQTQTFIDIPVTTQTTAELTIDITTQEPKLTLDVNGDNIPDFTITPKADFDPVLFLQIMRKTVDGFDISKQQKNTLLKRIDDTIKAIQKGKINKAKLKIEQFQKSLAIHKNESDKDRQERERKNEREHEKERRENKKPKQLGSADVQILLTMLNQLLDNLNK